MHDIAEDIDGDFAARVRHIDVVDCAVKGGVGVHAAAGFLDLLVYAASRAGGRALEKHVLEHVRQAGPQPLSLMNAASHAPGLRRDYGSAVILANDDSEAVLQPGEMNSRWRGGNLGCG